MYSLLKILLVILLVVIIGEAGFYLYFRFGESKNALEAQTANVSTPPTSVPVSPIVRGAFNSTYLNNLLNNKNIASSTLTNTFEGTVVHVYPTPGVIAGPKISYQKALEIQNRPDAKAFWAYYTENDLAVLQTVKQVGESEQPIQFEQMKPGDTVFIQESYDLVNSQTKELKVVLR